MEDIKLRLPNFWDENPTQISPVLLIKTRKERRLRHKDILIEVLRNVNPRKPTKLQFQKLCRIRRTKFLVVLKSLLACGAIRTWGTGKKNDPLTYGLDNSYLS